MARLLYLGPSGIGDWCFIYPSFQRLLEAYNITHTTIVLAYRNPWNSLLSENPLINQIIYLDRETKISHFPIYGLRWLRKAIKIMREGYDIAAMSYLSNQPDFLTIALVSGAKIRIGLHVRNSWYERLVISNPVNAKIGDGKIGIHNKYVVSSKNVGSMEKSIPLFNPSLFNKRDEIVSSLELIPDQYVILGIGGGRNAWWKFWPANYYREVINRFPEITYVLMGGGDDDIRQIRAMVPLPTNAVDLVGKIDVVNALKVLSLARAVIGNDSGITNIACTLKIPTICIYGPTDPKTNGPALLGAKALTAGVSCQPCFLDDQDPSKAESCNNRICLDKLTPDKAILELKGLLKV